MTRIGSEHCVARRRDSRPAHWSVGQISGRNPDRRSMHRHAVLQSPHGGGGESTGCMQVRIMDSTIAKPLRSVAPVIIDIHDPRVADVHAAEVAKASAIPWEERLTEAQRAPSETSQGEAEVDTPARAAKPGHQCWCIDWTGVNRPRRPSPVAARVHPAAIVEGSVSPGCVIDPGPTPRLNPDPVTILIRSPTRRHGTWNPHRTVRRDFTPHAVVIEVFVADRSRRHVARRQGSVLTLIAHRAPAIETVVGRGFGRRMGHRVSIGEANLLVRVNPHSRPLTGGIAFTLADGHDTRVAIRIHIKSIVSRLLNGERHVGSVDFVDFAAKQMADMQVQCSLVEFYLHGAVADVRQREACLRAHAHGAGADV